MPREPALRLVALPPLPGSNGKRFLIHRLTEMKPDLPHGIQNRLHFDEQSESLRL